MAGQLSSIYPDALVVLTVRRSADAWWRSANATMLEKSCQPVSPSDPLAVSSSMIAEMMSLRFTPDWNDQRSSMEADERHSAAVREGVPHDRLLEWKEAGRWMGDFVQTTGNSDPQNAVSAQELGKGVSGPVWA